MMAQVIDNDIMAGLSGRLGKRLALRHLRDGRTILLTRPNFSERVFSGDQLTHQSRFQQASAYAKVAAKTQPLYAELAGRTQTPAYNIALSDWFKPPVIHQVTRQDGCIFVHATDNVQVTRVLITIIDEQGQTLEEGEAALVRDGLWEYKPASPIAAHLLIEAFDLAGNIARHEA
jgi:hypothetical protein